MHGMHLKVIGTGIHKALQIFLGIRTFNWYPTGNFPLIPLHQYENLLVRFGHLSWVSGIPEMSLGHPATKQKLRFGHPSMKYHLLVWPLSSFTRKICSLDKDKHQMTKPCKYHPLKTCNNDGITLGKFLPSGASAMLGCPKLKFLAPVGAPWIRYDAMRGRQPTPTREY